MLGRVRAPAQGPYPLISLDILDILDPGMCPKVGFRVHETILFSPEACPGPDLALSSLGGGPWEAPGELWIALGSLGRSGMIYPGLSMLLRKCTFTKTSYFSRIMLIFDVHIVKNMKK